MNLAHLHLLLNHFPIIGSILGLGLFLVSFVGKRNQDLRRGSYIIFAAMALIAIPTFESGFSTATIINGKAGISQALIERHEGSAMLSIWFMLVTGAVSLVGLWQMYRDSRAARWNVACVLIFSVLTIGLMARTANTGGDIRHPEVRGYVGDTVKEGTIGSVFHVFEPNPEKFAQNITANKYWWGALMGVHFMGLALLIGTVGILDIRIIGFFKQLPLAPLHNFVPWALAGFGINVLTGLLAFIGQSDNYTFDYAFWLKMLALLLLGLNAAVFYLTDIFGDIEQLGPGEDAPISAKLVAVGSLALWIAVITLGRYIQSYTGTIPY